MSKAGFLAMPQNSAVGTVGYGCASALLPPPGVCPKSLPVPRAGEGPGIPCLTRSSPLPDPSPPAALCV